MATLGTAITSALEAFNLDRGFNQTNAWSWGMNWKVNTDDFLNFTNEYLVPRLNALELLMYNHTNRFQRFYKENEFILSPDQEFTFSDIVPTSVNLASDAVHEFEQYFAQVKSKLYPPGQVKSTKISFNDIAMRIGAGSTFKDMVKLVVSTFGHRLSMFNYFEERETLGMIIDYANTQTKAKRTASSLMDAIQKLNVAIMDMQEASNEYNEAESASGDGTVLTSAKLQDIVIITSNEIKARILDTYIANLFNSQGLDLTSHIISFNKLGGVYRINKNVTISAEHAYKMHKKGIYNVKEGDTLFMGTILSYNPQEVGIQDSDFNEIKANSDNFIYVFDKNILKLEQNTKNMLGQPTHLNTVRTTTYVPMYITRKAMRPFFNNVVIE